MKFDDYMLAKSFFNTTIQQNTPQLSTLLASNPLKKKDDPVKKSPFFDLASSVIVKFHQFQLQYSYIPGGKSVQSFQLRFCRVTWPGCQVVDSLISTWCINYIPHLRTRCQAFANIKLP